MSMRTASKLRTICEVLREINDLFQGNSKDEVLVRKKLAEAEKMAKRMQGKLVEYSKEKHKDWWERNPNYAKALKRRTSSAYLSE